MPPTNAETKQCPFCAEQILVQAKKCKHCGEFLDKATDQQGVSVPNSSHPEKTEYEAHPPMFRSRPIEFVITLVLCLVGIGLIIFLVWWIRNLGTLLTVTSRRTILRRGILSKFTSEVFHKDVRNVQVSQNVLQRLCDVGTIAISSSGQSDFEISVDSMPEPNRVKQIIDNAKNA